MLGVRNMDSKAVEVEKVTEIKVKCDGGSGGHPRVWLQIPQTKKYVVCPYCDKKFELIK